MGSLCIKMLLIMGAYFRADDIADSKTYVNLAN